MLVERISVTGGRMVGIEGNTWYVSKAIQEPRGNSTRVSGGGEWCNKGDWSKKVVRGLGWSELLL